MLRFDCAPLPNWPHVRRTILNTIVFRQYFKPMVNPPTTSQVQMSPSVLKRVNQEVKAALECEEAGRQATKKR